MSNEEGNKQEVEVIAANKKVASDDPQIHLSATDHILVEDATQVVFHKFRDGELFIELFTKKEIEQIIPYYSFTISDDARRKLREFLNTPVTY
jgi:hypothetical protein